MPGGNPTRREFLRNAVLAGAFTAAEAQLSLGDETVPKPLDTFSYRDIRVSSPLHERQAENCRQTLMAFSDDSLLRPFRQMAGVDAPGDDLGGWYAYREDYDYRKDTVGFAPTATFGQWVSALARMYAANGDRELRARVLRLNQLLAKSLSAGLFEKNRFPAYCYDKMLCGLIDSHTLANDPDAFAILKHTTEMAVPHLPGRAIPHDQNWRPGKDISWDWDESYTLPENLFLASQRGAGKEYGEMASRYLYDDGYFNLLAEGQNAMAGKHAYSHVNALSSALQAYLTLGSEKHLRAAKNGFDIVTAQSFATGGWGPDEQLRETDSDDLCASLTKTHNSFETPCGAYAHFKMARYLLRITRDSRYGDSMERVMYNTVLGAKPFKSDGSTFYYSDYNFRGRKVYHNAQWPCCSGTLPQVAADYGVNSYLRETSGLYVNLYLPSTVRFEIDGAEILLTQDGAYPLDEQVHFVIKSSREREFALHLRIPAWCDGASISINGKRQPITCKPGSFARVYRSWRDGDRLDLELPMGMGLEPINSRHPDVVALVRGPLVLFPIGDLAHGVTRKNLLAAKRRGSERWEAQSGKSPILLLPFTAIQDETYSTYLKLRHENS